MEQNTLRHHGIPGQKWYVRRYQRPDGSLTRAGKRRYRKELYKELSGIAKEHGHRSEAMRKRVNEEVKKNLTSKDIDKIRRAKAKSEDSRRTSERAQHKLDRKTKRLAKQYYRNYKEDNPGFKSLGARRRAKQDVYALAKNDVERKHPILKSRANKSTRYNSKYEKAVRKVTRKTIGRYGNRRWKGNRNSRVRWTIDESVKNLAHFNTAADNFILMHSDQPYYEYIY